MRITKMLSLLAVLKVAILILLAPAPAAAQEKEPAKVEFSGQYSLVRNEFNNHATSVAVAVPTAKRWAPRFQFINVPTVGKAYLGGLQYRRNLADLKVPASAQFNPKYFDVVVNAQGGVFRNANGDKAATASVGGRLEFTPEGSDVTIVVFDYQRLRSRLLQGTQVFRNNNLVSAGITLNFGR